MFYMCGILLGTWSRTGPILGAILGISYKYLLQGFFPRTLSPILGIYLISILSNYL